MPVLAVTDKSDLTAIEAIYGDVPAPQIVWTDSGDHLPGDQDYANPPGSQRLLGTISKLEPHAHAAERARGCQTRPTQMFAGADDIGIEGSPDRSAMTSTLAAAEIGAFLDYMRRRLLFMACGAVLAITVGVAGLVLIPSTGIIWTVTLGIGVALTYAAGVGMRLVSRGHAHASEVSQQLTATVWPTRTLKSITNNRILITPDEPTEAHHTPLAELSAPWWTPGLSKHPAGDALVFGSIERGQVVLIATAGGCAVGRLGLVRASDRT